MTSRQWRQSDAICDFATGGMQLIANGLQLEPRLGPAARAAMRVVMRIVLFQPGIAANFGNILRSAACFDVPVSVIEPLGFPLATKDVRRAAMDYGRDVSLTRHPNWESYSKTPARHILFTTGGTESLEAFRFAAGDHLIFGNESAGVPQSVHDACDLRVSIPIRGRSLNLSNSVAIALFEALRQTDGLSKSVS